METAIVVVVKVHIPIVVQLSGELGNHLSKLAAGIGVALELQKGNNNYINNTNAPIQSHNDDDDDPMSRLLARRNDQSTDTTKEPPSIPQQQLQPPPPHSHYYYQIVPRLVLKHQQHTTKWESAVQVLHQCFPYWTTMNVSEASSTLLMSNEEPTTGRTNNATTSSTTENSNTSGNNHINNLNNNNALWDDINSHEAAVHNATRIDAAIQSMVAATVQAAAQDNSLQTIIESMRRDARTFGNGTITIDWTSPITFYSDYLTTLDVYMDRYFDVYRRVFAMIRSDAQISSSKSKDKSSFLRPESVSTFPLSASSVCCSPDTAPIPGEVVFYLRGFVTEMPRKGISMGYEEASPETLLQILAHPSFSTAAAASNTTSASTPKPKEKLIAIVSRYAYVESVIHPYIDVLSDAGWIVRVVHHNATAAVDFCFLASTLPSNRLIGLAKSTFFLWAAVLSSSISNDSPVDASRITAYSINSTAKRAWAKAKNFPLRDDYMWTHPALTNEWQFPLYSQ